MSETTMEPEAQDASGDDLRSILSEEFSRGADPAPEPAEQTDTRPRDERGRFTSGERQEHAPEPSAVPTEHSAEPEPLAAPQSWAELQDEWANLPRKAQEMAIAREEAARKQAEEWEPTKAEFQALKQVLEPHATKYRMQGISDAQAVQMLLAAADALDRQPRQALAHLARNYGLTLNDILTPDQQQTQQPGQPQQAPVDVEQLIERRLAARDQQLAQQQTIAAIDAFAADPKHPYFAQVRTAMGALMQAGTAKDMETAYAMACRADETVWTKMEAERQRQEAAKKAEDAKATAAKARAAGVSVRNSSIGSASPPTASRGSVREDLQAAWADLR